jgi:NAD dependent epimerase/dehydratase
MYLKKVFLTGASGFIGSHIAELLIKNNFYVKALVQYDMNNSSGWLSNINFKQNRKKIKIISGDILDEDFINREIKNCDYVIHLAALISIPYSYVSPRSYINTNVIGTLNLLEASRKNNIKRFIHTSTSEVYGSAQYTPIDEKHPLNAQSPYAASKIAADQLVLSYCRSFNFPAIIIRPFNTFGPRQSTRAVIPTIISQMIENKKKISLGSLNTKRDFTYVEDTANAYLKTLNKKKIKYGEVINLGTGISYSIKETLSLIEGIFNRKVFVEKDLKRKRPLKSEVNLLLSDNKKAKKIINWRPKYIKKKGFKLALKKTVRWFLGKQNLSNYSGRYTI